MKNKGPSVERSDWIQAKVDSKGVISVTHDSESDVFTFADAIEGTTKLVRSYPRKSGKDKVVMEIPSKSGQITFDAYKNLKADFDHLIAVDTNTKKHSGAWVSITVAYAVPDILCSYGPEMPYNFLDGFLKARLSLSSDNEG